MPRFLEQQRESYTWRERFAWRQTLPTFYLPRLQGWSALLHPSHLNSTQALKRTRICKQPGDIARCANAHGIRPKPITCSHNFASPSPTANPALVPLLHRPNTLTTSPHHPHTSLVPPRAAGRNPPAFRLHLAPRAGVKMMTGSGRVEPMSAAAACGVMEPSDSMCWHVLTTSSQELKLDFTLPTGQSFRWRKTGENEHMGVIGGRVVQLQQHGDRALYRVIGRGPGCLQQDDAAVLHDYFNLDTSLTQLCQEWCARDPHFSRVAPFLPGARMLRQDPVECLFQFICSSNNHISRIHGMVDTLCSLYGTPVLLVQPKPPGAAPAAFAQLQHDRNRRDASGELAPSTPVPVTPALVAGNLSGVTCVGDEDGAASCAEDGKSSTQNGSILASGAGDATQLPRSHSAIDDLSRTVVQVSEGQPGSGSSRLSGMAHGSELRLQDGSILYDNTPPPKRRKMQSGHGVNSSSRDEDGVGRQVGKTPDAVTGVLDTNSICAAVDRGCGVAAPATPGVGGEGGADGDVEVACLPDVSRPHETELPKGSFYAFPTLQQLEKATEMELRERGFGYRAKFIVGSVKMLNEQPGGGAAWLHALRKAPYDETVQALCTLPGIGPKVAACVALFSLDKHEAIPVDTHVWDIAVRHYTPHLKSKSLTKAVHGAVQAAFVERFGAYAGWAHNTLFIAELASMQHHLPANLQTKGGSKGNGAKAKSNKRPPTANKSRKGTVLPPDDAEVDTDVESSGSEREDTPRAESDGMVVDTPRKVVRKPRSKVVSNAGVRGPSCSRNQTDDQELGQESKKNAGLKSRSKRGSTGKTGLARSSSECASKAVAGECKELSADSIAFKARSARRHKPSVIYADR